MTSLDESVQVDIAAVPADRAWTRWSTRLTLVGLGAVALRGVDDAWLQPTSGLTADDHILAGLVPLLLCGATALVVLRSRGAARTCVTLLAGLWGVVGGAELFIESSPGHRGVQPDDVSGIISLVGGAGLIVAFLCFASTSPSRAATRPARFSRRAATAVGALVASTVVVFPLGLAYVATHFAGQGITTAPDLGAPVERVEFEASDGLDLSGWYSPTSNGAVVIVYPGRSGLDHARMLTRHGYGVLLVNRRGDGDSEGDPNLFGWGAEQDVEGAVRHLQSRPEVEPDSIGALGLSVGGEVLLQHASQYDGLSAVVSEGAGSRSIRESLELTGGLRLAELTTAPLLTSGLVVLTDQAPPPNLVDLARELPPTPALIIYGEEGQPAEIELGRRYAEAAAASSTTWEVPGAAHIKGLDAMPAEYERRVVEFLDHALLHPSMDGEAR